MPKGTATPVPYRKFFRRVVFTQTIVAIGLSPLLPLTAVAQPVAPSPTPAPTAGGAAAPNITLPTGTSNIILPTDVLPLTAGQDKIPFGENMLLRINQILPSRFYFSASCETSLRYETNPFQYPKKSIFVRRLPPPQQLQQLPLNQQLQIQKLVQQVNSEDTVFRILPNVTGGWTVTPRTRLFANYFMIRDQLAKNVTLNTMIHSYAWGVQQDIPIGSRANLQAELQFRELNQWHQQSVFDFLPGLTLSYIVNPKTVAFANALLQMRGKKYFQGPTKELDPFYTLGLLHTRGGWTFALSSTFVQNFREIFGPNATIRQDNFAIISDFEVARRLFRTVPGLQAFVRAEPIFNFHSKQAPGLSGVDFRLFYGLRFAVAKPALTASINNIIEQLRNQENDPPPGGKPSASLPPQVMAGLQQQIHGAMDGTTGDTDAVKVASATEESMAADSIANAEGEASAGPADAIADAAPAEIVEPVEFSKADWKPILSAGLRDEKDFVLHDIHSQLDEMAAESTRLAYNATAERTQLIAKHTDSAAPRIEIAKANWDAIAAAAARLPESRFRLDGVDDGSESIAAQSSQLAYSTTAKHAGRYVAAAPPVVASKPAAPVVAPAPVVASTPVVPPAPITSGLRPMVLPQDVEIAIAPELPAPVIASKPVTSGIRPMALPSDNEIAIAPELPAPVIASKPVTSGIRPMALPSDSEIAIAPELAATVIASKPVTSGIRPMVVAQDAEIPIPAEPQIALFKADWTSIASAARQIKTNDTVFDGGSLVESISSAASHSTTYGASATEHRLASLWHATPPPEAVAFGPTPRIPEIAATPPPTPLSGTRNQLAINAPALPAPSRISASSAEAPKPLSLAAQIPPAPMTKLQTAAPCPTTKPSTLAVATPLPKPVAAVATIPATPVAAVGPIAHAVPPAVSASIGSLPQPTALPAPAPAAISMPASAPATPVVVGSAAPPHTVPSIPTPIKALDTPRPPFSQEVVAVLPPAAAPPAPVVEKPAEKTIDLAAAGNWDSIAKLGDRKSILAMQYLGDLRFTINRAVYESARVLDYEILHSADRPRIAARPPKAPPAAKPATPPPTMFVPMQADLTPRSITADRPETEQRTSTGWHTRPSRSGAEKKMGMHIVPPLPTVQIKNKENPFQGSGIDFKKPLMMSVPH
jgi:hypothetical protein